VPGATLGDLGVREGAAVYFLAAFGGAAAFNATLGVFALKMLQPAVVGVPLVVRLRVGARNGAAAVASELPATVPVAGAPSRS
jgi:hypothetical protein